MKYFNRQEIDRLGNKYAANPILRDIPPTYPGWEDLLDTMLLELMMYMEEHDVEIVIAQCKVKWGMLRVYTEWRDESCEDAIPEEVNNIILKYESLSNKICKICSTIKQETVVESRITYECMTHYGDRRA